MIHGFDSTGIVQFSAMTCSDSGEGSLNRVAHSIYMFLLLTLSKSFLFFFVCIWCLLTTQFSLVILGLILVSYWDTWCRKLEFCVTSFWFYYHRLWWSSWHAILALFLLYVFLVWNFSWRDLFQVTRIDASCVFYIICSQFIPFEQVTLYFAY